MEAWGLLRDGFEHLKPENITDKDTLIHLYNSPRANSHCLSDSQYSSGALCLSLFHRIPWNSYMRAVLLYLAMRIGQLDGDSSGDSWDIHRDGTHWPGDRHIELAWIEFAWTWSISLLENITNTHCPSFYPSARTSFQVKH
jgi:hypothetical protein